jgi:hypothetical protein
MINDLSANDAELTEGRRGLNGRLAESECIFERLSLSISNYPVVVLLKEVTQFTGQVNDCQIGPVNFRLNRLRD